MDKKIDKKVISQLQAYLDMLPHYRNLDPHNREFSYWNQQVIDYLIANFGNTSDEYIRYDGVKLAWLTDNTPEAQRQAYIDSLNKKETTLKSIIQKYEILETAREGEKESEVNKMEINEGIKLLIHELDELPKLRIPPFSKEQYAEWYGKVCNILELTFSKTSREYVNFARAVNYDYFVNTEHEKKEKYNKELDAYEIALKSAIHKGELLIKQTIPPTINEEPPKAFIVHGGKSGVLDKLCEFIEALGVKPLVVEMLPSKGMTLAEKVKKYQQEADCAIILATRGGIIDIKSGKQHPRLNVVDELSSFWEAFPQKVILLLEKGAELPSNKAGLTYEPFARQSMDRAFTAIARELTEMKILKAIKPQ